MFLIEILEVYTIGKGIYHCEYPLATLPYLPTRTSDLENHKRNEDYK